MLTLLSYRLRDEDGIYRLTVAQAMSIAFIPLVLITAVIKAMCVRGF